MYVFKGNKAFTVFRSERILLRLKKKQESIQNFSADLFYFVQAKRPLSSLEIEQLAVFLPKSQFITLPKEQKGVFIVPRLGTISPWSSKATEIAQTCGLEFVERIERGIHYQFSGVVAQRFPCLLDEIYDPLIESAVFEVSNLQTIFDESVPGPLKEVELQPNAVEALRAVNQQWGLALSNNELSYLASTYQTLGRNPTDVELMMFAQVNSEHCRHKIFNARWRIDGEEQQDSLFAMIRHTYYRNPNSVLIAYEDNAAVLQGGMARRLIVNPTTKTYTYKEELTQIVFKVETHNHPTAIAPFPGAATGSGGEIRDEAATGRGARTKMGLIGFSVSHLHIPGFEQPWEKQDIGKPPHLSSALEIMLQGPIGAASFNNEFGRPCLSGYFRTFGLFVETDYGSAYRGYHKPIMIAGGVGNISEQAVHKKNLSPGDQLIVIGGPAMPIGLGGGAASSRVTSEYSRELDFSSVQRANPEMQRRCQEVIDRCWALAADNPILSIHDVGAGGLSNALPELVKVCNQGATIELRQIPSVAMGMTPMEVWCNEAQERYVLAISVKDLALFQEIAARERCPYAVVGEVVQQDRFVVKDCHFGNKPIDLPMSFLFENMQSLECHAERVGRLREADKMVNQDLGAVIKQVLQFPCVASKSFLITIGDRTITGLVARDQMVGPWQVPVADVAVTCSDFTGYTGEALAMGERAPIALLHHAASARMAIGEAITNIAAASIGDIQQLVLSANWMAAPNMLGEAAGLYDAVQAVGMELCPALGISIPVGKDSLSMRTEWEEEGVPYSVTAPLSLIVSAAAKVKDVRRTLTPELQHQFDSVLLLIDLGEGACALGGSVFAQIQGLLGETPPDLDQPYLLKSFFSMIQACNEKNLLLAYHDRSDGGLLVTIAEMMFAGHVGVDLFLDYSRHADMISVLFNEELGAVIQVSKENLTHVNALADHYGLSSLIHQVGVLNKSNTLTIVSTEKKIYSESRIVLQQWWAETSFRLQALRDHSECAQQEFDLLAEVDDPGRSSRAAFSFSQEMVSPYLSLGARPKVAILREQGVNGQIEMAAAFDRVGFTSVDVHMHDLLIGKVNLNEFSGLVACGGFSYGDVLGAGRGWAQSILQHHKIRDAFSVFFNRAETFALGVCNGCQMFSQIKSIIPGAEHWPRFIRNRSEQFEARLVLVAVEESPSLFFNGMTGSILPVPVAHGEGLVVFDEEDSRRKAAKVVLRYVDHRHRATMHYPENPNGSVGGATGFTTTDGRVTILMTHPERSFRSLQLSWHPREWGEDSPWLRFFANARVFVS